MTMSEPDVVNRMRRELVSIFHDTGIDTGNLLAAVDEVQADLAAERARAERAEAELADLRPKYELLRLDIDAQDQASDIVERWQQRAEAAEAREARLRALLMTVAATPDGSPCWCQEPYERHTAWHDIECDAIRAALAGTPEGEP